MELKTISDLKKLIENIPDDFHIQMRVHKVVPEKELEKRSYKFPYDTYIKTLNYDDIGYSDKEVCLSVEFNED